MYRNPVRRELLKRLAHEFYDNLSPAQRTQIDLELAMGTYKSKLVFQGQQATYMHYLKRAQAAWKARHVKANPVKPHPNLTEILEMSYAFVNAHMQALSKWQPCLPKDNVRCFGCNSPDCCELFVETLLPEAVVILHKMSTEGRDVTLRNLVLQGRRQYAFAGNPMADFAGYMQRMSQWCDKKEQCVLLDENGRCSVYDYAPSTCRRFFVTNNTDCAAGNAGTQQEIYPTEQLDIFTMQTLPLYAKKTDAPSDLQILPKPIGAMVEAAGEWLLPGVDLTDLEGSESDV